MDLCRFAKIDMNGQILQRLAFVKKDLDNENISIFRGEGPSTNCMWLIKSYLLACKIVSETHR